MLIRMVKWLDGRNQGQLSNSRAARVRRRALWRRDRGDLASPPPRAAPQCRDALGGLVDDPGLLSPATVEESESKKAPLRCFEVQVPPDRRLLAWCVENPERLTRPVLSDPATRTEIRRRSLICDDTPGTRDAVQREARKLVETRPVGQRAWWRQHN